MITATLDKEAERLRIGVAVLLVYGIRIPVAREGRPGFRLTVQCDGSVHVEPVGFEPQLQAAALHLLIRECRQIDLDVDWLPTPGIVVRRRRTP